MLESAGCDGGPESQACHERGEFCLATRARLAENSFRMYAHGFDLDAAVTGNFSELLARGNSDRDARLGRREPEHVTQHARRRNGAQLRVAGDQQQFWRSLMDQTMNVDDERRPEVPSYS